MAANRSEKAVAIGVPLTWLGVFFLLPLAIVAVYSVLTRGPYGGVVMELTLDNYQRVLDPLYVVPLIRALKIAALTTGLCLVVGYPAALWIARQPVDRRNILLVLIMVPFWTDFLVRTYAWMFILRTEGLLNTTLLSLGIIGHPLDILFTETAVLIGSVYAYLPFMVLPVYASLEKIDPSMISASQDLGATPTQTLMHVILPLSRSGVLAGSMLVFIPVFGAFIIPDLLGGSRTSLIGNIIKDQFLAARDWPFGSALSLIVMTAVLLVLWGYLRLSHADPTVSRRTT